MIQKSQKCYREVIIDLSTKDLDCYDIAKSFVITFND